LENRVQQQTGLPIAIGKAGTFSGHKKRAIKKGYPTFSSSDIPIRKIPAISFT
jgi:hypothetical protein